MFACPNPDCDLFNRFGAGSLSVVEHTGKGGAIRRLYCGHCGERFSERKGSLMAYAKLPEAAVVRIVAHRQVPGPRVLGVGDGGHLRRGPRTVGRILRRGGERAADFHRLQVERLAAAGHPPEAVELGELHARVHGGADGGAHDAPGGQPGEESGPELQCRPGAAAPPSVLQRLTRRVTARWAGTGSTWPWR